MGIDVAYERAGVGPPLVLLHGILGDSRVWKRQLAGLADTFTVVAWDAPGAGRSGDPPERFTFADWADCLKGLLDAAGIEHAHVLGLSWGGVLAQEFYDRHSTSVRSLVIADSYAGWKGSLPESVCQERLAASVREAALPAHEFIPAWMPGLVSDEAGADLQDEIATIISDYHPAGYRLMAAAIARADTRPLLPRIQVPTLLIWGERDARSSLPVARALHAAIPNATLAIVLGAGHLSNMEQPAAFNAEVRRFCTAVDGG
jgi:pimeloyl-ACP methyl ester carboxylesterase